MVGAQVLRTGVRGDGITHFGGIVARPGCAVDDYDPETIARGFGDRRRQSEVSLPAVGIVAGVVGAVSEAAQFGFGDAICPRLGGAHCGRERCVDDPLAGYDTD